LFSHAFPTTSPSVAVDVAAVVAVGAEVDGPRVEVASQLRLDPRPRRRDRQPLRRGPLAEVVMPAAVVMPEADDRVR